MESAVFFFVLGLLPPSGVGVVSDSGPLADPDEEAPLSLELAGAAAEKRPSGSTGAGPPAATAAARCPERRYGMYPIDSSFTRVPFGNVRVGWLEKGRQRNLYPSS